MTLIDGHEYFLLRDYDKGKYHNLTFEGKVTYIRKRVEFILLNPCKSAMPNTATSDLGLVLTTAICAGISAASTFLNGKKRAGPGEDKKYFLAFIKRYMNPNLQKLISGGTVTWAKWLYTDLRCGLSHSFTIHTGGVEESAHYLQVTKHGPEICPSLLLADFEAGWIQYLRDVEADGPTKPLGKSFQDCFDEVFHD